MNSVPRGLDSGETWSELELIEDEIGDRGLTSGTVVASCPLVQSTGILDSS